MKTPLVVVENPADWPLDIPDVEVVAARVYLTDPTYSELRRARVFNLCRDYRYQRTGYYVSLLAAARGHRPLPDISTMRDLKMPAIVRSLADDIDALTQRSLKPLRTDMFSLSVYFGQNVAKRYKPLAGALFQLFAAPLLRAQFVRVDEKWTLRSIQAIAARDIPEAHFPYVIEFAKAYLSGKRFRSVRPKRARYDLAILNDPSETNPASNQRAVRNFIRAGEALGLDVEVIGKTDYNRIVEFDALFIRDTTSVDHYTYRFARRAVAEGVVVVDDPVCILRCTNKVYLAELLARNGVKTPRTLLVSKGNSEKMLDSLEFPCILKKPDSSFSQGVTKVETPADWARETGTMLEGSELILAQEFVPTPFDWRVGVFDREVIYVCKYHMARYHWQIIRTGKDGRMRSGRVEAVPRSDAPCKLLETALKATRLIGDGLFGVDLKQVGEEYLVIEINENPSIDAGSEDALLKDDLYRTVMERFVCRIEARHRT